MGETMAERVAFFREYAGLSYHPAKETPGEGRERGARALALAEITANAFGWTVRWEPDPDPMWDDDVPRTTTDYDQWVCDLLDADGNLLQSLGSVDLGPDGWPDGPGADPYGRVVAAELAAEAAHDVHYRRPRAV